MKQELMDELLEAVRVCQSRDYDIYDRHAAAQKVVNHWFEQIEKKRLIIEAEPKEGGIPTLEELLVRISPDIPVGQDDISREQLIELYTRVAAGKRDPIDPPLPRLVVMFACQCMAILFHHVETHPYEDLEKTEP